MRRIAILLTATAFLLSARPAIADKAADCEHTLAVCKETVDVQRRALAAKDNAIKTLLKQRDEALAAAEEANNGNDGWLFYLLLGAAAGGATTLMLTR